MLTVFIAVLTTILSIFFGYWKSRSRVLPSQAGPSKKYRFRKRDKMLFFGRKMLRKVKNGIRRKPNHRAMMGRLRRFLAKQKESKPRVKQRSPPQSFLEADWSDFEDTHRLPHEVLYVLQSIRVFGHFEKPFFLELCRFMESVILNAGDYLFKIGDPDDSIYVVQSGLLHVYIADKNGTEHLIKQVETGSNVHSLLSVLDVLTGHPGQFKSVSCKAIQDSTVLRLPAHAFKSMFEKFNESTVKMVQIIMIRLQRVTFSALHNYMGLSKELLKQDVQETNKNMNVHELNKSGNPTKNCVNILCGSNQGSIDKTESTPHVLQTQPSRSGPTSTETKPSKQLYDGVREISDFDATLMQASEKSFISSGSPSEKSSRVEDGISTESRALPDEDFILDLACKDLVDILELKDPSLLEGRIALKYIEAGNILCKQGDQDCSLFFLVKGTVSVLQNAVGSSDKETLIFQSEPGEIIDVLAVLTGEPSFFTIRAKTDIIVAVITKPDFYDILKVEPFIILNIAHYIVHRISSFVRQIDFALDWQILEAGKALFRQKDASNNVYIILTGRLRSVTTNQAGKKELLSEFGRGELVGFTEVLTQHERTSTVLAVRDTELARIPAGLLTMIKLRCPQVATRLFHLLGKNILRSIQKHNTVDLGGTMFINTEPYHKREKGNLATVAIVAVTDDVPITNFSLELQHALQAIGPTCRLTSDIIKTQFGASALDNVNEFRLFNWLSQQEDIHRMILYQCEHQLTKWTKHCLRQADCILIVALADRGPTVGHIEKELGSIAVKAQKELILLHKEDADSPRNTADWLNLRGWLSSHHHIRCPKRVLQSKSKSSTDLYENLFKTDPDRMSGFSRLARFLTGTSIGLALGGGGARGLAHIGMIRSVLEAGIPIDMISGSSSGSFISALWAEDEGNMVRFIQRARECSKVMTSFWNNVWDLTYPVSSMFTGHAFNTCLETVFKDRQIEDLWIPYFCVTTDISNSSMRIHTIGSLWRYVRASMSLSGYHPPLCDPLDGHLLLDGGYVNLVPADVMHDLGARHVFAIDVTSLAENDLFNFGDVLSGWWLLWKRWCPWTSGVKVPDLNSIQIRLAYVKGMQQMEVVKNSDYCNYLRPPIERFALFEFGSFDAITEVGYHYGNTFFPAWVKEGKLEKVFKGSSSLTIDSKDKNLPTVPVMAYFSDLAEQVFKIPRPTNKFCVPTESYVSEDDLDDVLEEKEGGSHQLSNSMDGYEEDDPFAYIEEEEDEEFLQVDEIEREAENKDLPRIHLRQAYPY